MKIKQLLILIMIMISLSSCQVESIESLGTPGSMTINNHTLTLDPIENATSYIIEINGEMIEIDDIEYVLTHGNYDIRYQGVNRNQSTDFSDIFHFEIIDIIEEKSFEYSIHSTKDLKVGDANDALEYYTLSFNGGIVDDILKIVDNQLLIDHQAFAALLIEGEDVDLIIDTNEGLYQWTISPIATYNPYVMTNEQLSINDADALTFELDLFETQIISLSTNLDIDNESLGLVFDEDIITIDKSAVLDVFNQDETISRIVIVYQLYDEVEDTTYLGYLHILKD